MKVIDNGRRSKGEAKSRGIEHTEGALLELFLAVAPAHAIHRLGHFHLCLRLVRQVRHVGTQWQQRFTQFHQIGHSTH